MCSVKYELIFLLISLCALQFTNGAYLQCYYGCTYDFMVTPLNNPEEIMHCINSSLPTVIYTFGYRCKASDKATTAVLDTYLAKNDSNVLLLNWEDEASANPIGLDLEYCFKAVPNARKIGIELGNALLRLSTCGLNMADVHLIGYSLGAHLMGYAGKHVKLHGLMIPRITGLDPAGPLYDFLLALERLDHTCAGFVDIIHTNPGNYGLNAATGTVDIWLNSARIGVPQPGCPIGIFTKYSPEDLCSHERSWRYLVQSHGSFMYRRDLTTAQARGNYYIHA